MNLTGKTFLITGGASGLGAACAREFTAAGANVVLLDVAAHGDAVAQELGAKVRFARTDVTSPDQVQAAIDLAVREFGGLHGAINCAGNRLGLRSPSSTSSAALPACSPPQKIPRHSLKISAPCWLTTRSASAWPKPPTISPSNTPGSAPPTSWNLSYSTLSTTGITYWTKLV